MGKPLMLQEEDDKRLEKLRKQLGIKSKVQVLRDALSLLEERFLKIQRMEKWRRAVQLVSSHSAEVNSEFQKNNRFKRGE